MMKYQLQNLYKLYTEVIWEFKTGDDVLDHRKYKHEDPAPKINFYSEKSMALGKVLTQIF